MYSGEYDAIRSLVPCSCMQTFERQGIKNVFVYTALKENLTSVEEIVLGFGKQKAVLTCTQRQQGKRVKGTCHGKLARLWRGFYRPR